MKTMLKKFAAGAAITGLASAFSSCSPLLVAHPAPRPVVYTTEVIAPAPVQTVEIVPVIPVWAPPHPHVTNVHYYYFPDYSMYYDLVHQHYCYNNGAGWLYVSVLPVLPVFYGFNPYSSYLIVLNQSAYQPWIQHNYYLQQYPVGYYNTLYAPRTALGSNTILRAYDENRKQPMFIDKRSNKEVAVKYDVRPSRNEVQNSSIKSNSMASQSTGRSIKSSNQESVNGRSDPTKKNNLVRDNKTGSSLNPYTGGTSRSVETKKNKNLREIKSRPAAMHQPVLRSNQIKNNQPDNSFNDSRSSKKEIETKAFQAQNKERNTKTTYFSDKQNKGEQNRKRSK